MALVPWAGTAAALVGTGVGLVQEAGEAAV